MFNQTPIFSSYSVKHIDKALEFYHDILGLNVTQTNEGLSINQLGSMVFLYPKLDHEPASFTVLNFKVEDIDKVVEALKMKGVSIDRYDTVDMKSDDKGIFRGKASGNGPDIAWFKDPDGNILSVLQE